MAGRAPGACKGVERGDRREAAWDRTATTAVNLGMGIRLSVGEANMTGGAGGTDSEHVLAGLLRLATALRSNRFFVIWP